MTGTELLAFFAALVAAGVIAAIVVMRLSGPRPDAPLKGRDADRRPQGPGGQRAATSDRPGGPGQEPARSEPGDPAPGARNDDTR